jgi:hypothetical protein
LTANAPNSIILFNYTVDIKEQNIGIGEKNKYFLPLSHMAALALHHPIYE